MINNCYLIGSPVSQSPSADIMNAAFNQLNFPAHYYKLDILESDLSDFIKLFKEEAGLFFNVTIPHKAKVVSFLDELESEAQDIGAASCVLNDSGKLYGFNTDLFGFSRALDRHNISLRGELVDVLGAGGASKAIVYNLIRRGAEVRILNRTEDKAKETARQFNCDYGSLTRAGDSQRKLVINTTKAGMFPNNEETPISSKQISAYENVADIVYNPFETVFLRKAKEVGSKPLTGLGLDMLVFLLARSFEIGTGKNPDFNLIYSIAREKIGIS